MAVEIKKKHKLALWIVMAVYLVGLFYFLFFSESMGRTMATENYRYNLVLFQEIGRFFTFWKNVGFGAAFLNIGGNVVAFIPFGCLLAVLLDPKERWYLIALFSFEFSLCVEVVQLLSKLGCFDVDDLLLNTIGGLLGYGLYRLCRNIIMAKRRKQ